MTKYKEIFNPETGEAEYQFGAKLLQVGETVLQNSNGKDFKIVNLQFNLPSGEMVERSAICYASNYDHGIEPGKTYVSSLSFDLDGDPQLRMSHLTQSERASKDDFKLLIRTAEQLVDQEAVI